MTQSISVSLPGGNDSLLAALQQVVSGQAPTAVAQLGGVQIVVVADATQAALATAGLGVPTTSAWITCPAQLTEVQAVDRQSKDPDNGASYILTNPVAKIQAPDGSELAINYVPAEAQSGGN